MNINIVKNFLLGRNRKSDDILINNDELIMNSEGGIRLNYSNEKVQDSILEEMNKYANVEVTESKRVLEDVE